MLLPFLKLSLSVFKLENKSYLSSFSSLKKNQEIKDMIFTMMKKNLELIF